MHRFMRLVIASVVLSVCPGLLAVAADGDKPVKPGQLVIADSGLEYIDLVVGTGREAGNGDTATVHYTGRLQDGTKFDSSVDRGQPFSFRIGAGQVIKGWDEGVSGMKVGGKRKLMVPPHLGYGGRGAGNVIPPNAKLDFEVELLNLR